MLALRLILKDKDGNQHCLPFSGSNPGGLDVFEKEGTSEKGCIIGVSRMFYLKPVWFFVFC